MADTDYQFPVSGYDRADGLDGRPGTPTPEGYVQGANPAGSDESVNLVIFEELPDSPTIERGEQTTIIHRFKVDQITGYTYIASLSRGQILVDSFGNQTKVLSASVEYNKGDYWVLSITAEGFAGVDLAGNVSALDIPPDEFSVETLEFNPSIYRHPRYAPVLNYVDPVSKVTGLQIISFCQGAVGLAQIDAQGDQLTQINSTNITDSFVLALALELLGKLRLGEETSYLAGFKVVYSSYFYLPPDINPGGYLEDPVVNGNLPAYLWSDDGSGDADSNIFNALGPSVAPAFYTTGYPDYTPAPLSWLRQADTLVLQRTWFKLTSIWLGGPYGHWDAQIYDPNAAPPPVPS